MLSPGGAYCSGEMSLRLVKDIVEISFTLKLLNRKSKARWITVPGTTQSTASSSKPKTVNSKHISVSFHLAATDTGVILSTKERPNNIRCAVHSVEARNIFKIIKQLCLTHYYNTQFHIF